MMRMPTNVVDTFLLREGVLGCQWPWQRLLKHCVAQRSQPIGPTQSGVLLNRRCGTETENVHPGRRRVSAGAVRGTVVVQGSAIGLLGGGGRGSKNALHECADRERRDPQCVAMNKGSGGELSRGSALQSNIRGICGRNVKSIMEECGERRQSRAREQGAEGHEEE
ncbi:uncharacterized protein EI97DRAFT_214756 [Westerdykella ornata]|uniref:Uncharacterized protein n=1 Tax=Westerdykella ornata TaxID=318751 RepID=A0A6A6JQT8_WESOR|nr:uncharacterized protein EI97DRAFT_214756 [Westerdykella ornata]KAF2278604.1 hypothetical protein EI97DRAFT_214756 [Westerdykella ornata]